MNQRNEEERGLKARGGRGGLPGGGILERPMRA